MNSSLEGSNTDIADEFTKLIVTQQAYSANTKVITTANSMVQDLLNVLRFGRVAATDAFIRSGFRLTRTSVECMQEFRRPSRRRASADQLP